MLLSALRISSQFEDQRPGESLLAEVCLDASPKAPPIASWDSGLRRFSAEERREYWWINGPVEYGTQEQFRYAKGPSISWLGTHISLTAHSDIRQLSYAAFTQLLALAKRFNQAHLLRSWIVIPQITSGAGDQERYKQFCLGRYEAYTEAGIADADYPAATVVGSHDSQMRIHALCSTQPGQPQENPRQTSAYAYPREFGPRSPSFCRALRHEHHNLISGTAAVRGSISQHLDDAPAQLLELHANLLALLDESIEQQIQGRLYVKRPEDAAALGKLLPTLIPGSEQWPILHADICRPELLCEAELSIHEPV